MTQIPFQVSHCSRHDLQNESNLSDKIALILTNFNIFLKFEK